MRTSNDELLDALLRHQIGLLRYSGYLRNQIWRLLDETEGDLKEQIKRRLRQATGPITTADLKRTDRLLEVLRETRVKAWTQVTNLWVAEMTALVIAEPTFASAAIRTVVPVTLDLGIPSTSQLRDLVRYHPFEGKVLGAWAEDMRESDIARIERAVRIGMTQGEALPAISRRVVGSVKFAGRDGVTQITRNGAAAITRTAVNSLANESRRLFALENKEWVDRELFVATLDSRTTPICRALDGDVFPVGEGPIPALHFACRSMRVLLVDAEPIGDRPMKPVTERMLVEEFAQKRRLGDIRRRQDLPHGTRGAFDDFARKRVRELTGTVPAKTTYAEFLSRQSEAFQRDVLGVTRARLYRRGGVTLDRFVDRAGNEIPLRDLARIEADAFRAAGLDPEDFL